MWQLACRTTAIGVLLIASCSASAQKGENLLANGDFARWSDAGQPLGWRVGSRDQAVTLDRKQAPAGCAQSLRVDIRAVHANYGEIQQNVQPVRPGGVYVLSGAVRGTVARVALLQVKLYKGRTELKRITLARSGTEWQRVRREFSVGDADKVGILCRWEQKRQSVGATAWFADVRLVRAPPPALGAGQAVATFHCLGVRVKYTGGAGPGTACRLRYRRAGTEPWRRGMDLVLSRADSEFRGSVFALEPDRAYELQCGLFDRSGQSIGRAWPVTLTSRTWAPTVPIGQVKRLPPGVSNKPLVIREKGTADGWIVYKAAPEGSTIDAGTLADEAVLFDQAAYVVFENVTVRGGRRDGLRVRRSHHVRIRRCDVSTWGDAGTRKDGLDKGLYVDARGRPINYNAGVRVCDGSSQVVVEDNFLHGPRGTANAWKYGHPMGPQGLILATTGGNNVVRNNDMIGSDRHWWNDAIESISNGAVNGGPYRDTDIHGNVLAFSNDDGTELDGGQINVRYWHNWIDKALCGVSCAPNRGGPSYVFRNLIVLTGEEFFKTGAGFKMGGDRFPDPGVSLLLHNTVWTHGAGLTSGHYGKGPTPMVTRNNVFAGPQPNCGRIRYRHRTGGDFDHDLLPAGGVYGLSPAPASWQAHGTTGAPRFRDAAGGDFRLAPNSPGIDAGLALPGMNDEPAGKAPDLGAFERGRDAGACFPPRPGGLVALPMHVSVTSRVRAAGVVRLLAPASAGKTWRAHPNAPFLRCIPDAGPCDGAWQTVRLSAAGNALNEVRWHRGAVTFRTDTGLCRTVMANVKVLPKRLVRIDRQAEAGEFGGKGLRIASAADASGGKYVEAASIESDDPNQRRWAPAGALRFALDLPVDGTYRILARCAVPGPADRAGYQDSFFWSIDGGKKRMLPIAGYRLGVWQWMWVREPERPRLPVELSLKAGLHTLTIHTREPQTRIDRLVVTNAPYFDPPKP